MDPKHLPGIKLVDRLWKDDNDDFTVAVTDGRKGMNYGLDNGLDRTNNYLYGTHRGRYYLIGADSGVGKTTVGDFMFLLHPWMCAKRLGIPFYGKYLSFEISRKEKIARWVSFFVHLLFGRDMPSDYIMGRIPGLVVSDDDLSMIKVAKQYVDTILQDVQIVEGSVHPTWVFNWMVEHYEKIGTVLREKTTDPKKKGYIIGFKPNDPRQVTFLYADHVALAHEEKGVVGTKAVIDKLSAYAVGMRNTFGTSIAYYQQFNTELTSIHRTNKKGEVSIAPQRIDFGDSKYTYRDADVVCGLVSPIQFDVSSYKKFDIAQLGSYFLAMHLMKNRYGVASRMMPLFMNPISGLIQELPADPLNAIAMEPWYQEVRKMDKVIEIYKPKENVA